MGGYQKTSLASFVIGWVALVSGLVCIVMGCPPAWGASFNAQAAAGFALAHFFHSLAREEEECDD